MLDGRQRRYEYLRVVEFRLLPHTANGVQSAPFVMVIDLPIEARLLLTEFVV